MKKTTIKSHRLGDTPKRVGLFVFRRDLRVVDNRGLLTLSQLVDVLHVCFIFTPEQVGPDNAFRSDASVQFMIDSLDDLQHACNGRLGVFYGDNVDVLKRLVRTYNITDVCYNKDITPYAVRRDKAIHALCKSMNVILHEEQDYYLHDIGSVMTGSGEAYQKFTPFYHACQKSASKIETVNHRKVDIDGWTPKSTISLATARKRFLREKNDAVAPGGRTEGVRRLTVFARRANEYSSHHDDLSEHTSELSAYIKFGCVSIREVYHAIHTPAFRRQLIWRDFYANVAMFYPHVFKGAMKEKYNRIQWNSGGTWFRAWCEGRTGFPVVDAGMRQLNATGYCHNRARLIVMSFLVKTMLIDWRRGEKYFASRLVDYDPASNNGNIQWVAGTGADSQPYFRIFNPMRQQKEYDPKAIYIRRWVPELADVPIEDIHKWDTKHSNYPGVYIPPILNYDEEKKHVLDAYKRVFS